LVLTILVLAAPAAAQLTRGVISGTVHDPSGAVVESVQVAAIHLSTRIRREFETNGAGIYRLVALEPGTYALELAKQGFQPLRIENLQVGATEERILDLTLALASPTAEITVEAPPAGALLSKASATIERSLGERLLESLPLMGRRDVAGLNLLAPMVVRVPGLQPTSTNGQRANNEIFLLDGVDNKDPWIVGRVFSMQPEAVSELRIQTSAYSAEFGRGAGSQVSVVTRSGSNQFHGSVWDYYGANWMSAATLPNKRAGVSSARFQEHQAGGTLGGPLRKDRTFFFAQVQAEPHREGTNANASPPITIPTPEGWDALARVPLATGQTPENRQAILATIGFLPEIHRLVRQYDSVKPEVINGTEVPMGTTAIPLARPSDLWLVRTRLDHQLGAKDSLTYRYLLGHLQSPFGGGFTNEQFGPLFASSNDVLYRGHSISHTRVFNPRWLSEARFAYTGTLNNSPLRGEAGPYVNIQNSFAFGGNAAAPWQRDGRSWQWQGIATYVRGRHALKFGLDVSRVREEVLNQTSVRGQWTFTSFADFVNNRAMTFFQAFAPSITDVLSVQQSYFVQDDVKLRPNLTLNLGLRYQTANVPDGLYGTTEPAFAAVGVLGPVRRDGNDWAPRFGLAYSPRSGRTVLRAGFGLAYLQDAYSGFVPQTRNNYPRNVTDQRTQPETILLYPVMPAKPATIPALDPMAQFTNAPTDTQNPTTHFYSASIQRELGANYILELGYSGNRSYHLRRTGERNPALLTEAQAARVIAGNAIPGVRQRRVNPAWGSRLSPENTATSSYNAGYVRFDRRLAGGLLVGANYTYSATLDDGIGNPQDYLDYRPEYGRSLLDRPHRFVVHYSWQIPSLTSYRLLRTLVQGWQLSGYSEWQSGEPFTVTTGVDSNGDSINNTDRPNSNPGGSITLDPVTGDWRTFRTPLDGSGIFVTPLGTAGLPLANSVPKGGNLGRNIFRAPAYTSWSLDLAKSFRVTERMHLQVRASSTNLFNHRNFGPPVAAMSSLTFGTNTSDPGSRVVLLGAKIQF
jgi:hypothetical protein